MIEFLFQPHHALDFTVNILFSSYNFLGPFIFWLLNPRIRRRADLALYQMVIIVAQTENTLSVFTIRENQI